MIDLAYGMTKLDFALRGFSSEICKATKSIKLLSDALRNLEIKEKSNNWRKLHGFPMRRRKCNQ